MITDSVWKISVSEVQMSVCEPSDDEDDLLGQSNSEAAIVICHKNCPSWLIDHQIS